MKRRTYLHDSQAFLDESFRRAQLASPSRVPNRARVEELRLIEAAPGAAQKFIDFPVSRPVLHNRPDDARLAG